MIESVLRGIILQKAESPVAKTVVVDISKKHHKWITTQVYVTIKSKLIINPCLDSRRADQTLSEPKPLRKIPSENIPHSSWSPFK